MQQTQNNPPPGIARQMILPLNPCPTVCQAHHIRLQGGTGSQGKTPIPGISWQQDWPDWQTIRQHIEAGGNAGMEPSTAILSTVEARSRLVCFDLDSGDADLMTRAYPPICRLQTERPGGAHLYYFHEGGREIRNGKWSGGPGKCGGDLRGIGGYVKMHNDAYARLDNALQTLDWRDYPAPLALIEAVTQTCAGKAASRSRTIKGLNQGVMRRAASLFRAACRVAQPNDRGFVLGRRHCDQVIYLKRWGGRIQWDGQPVTDEYIARKAASYWLAMPGDFPQAEVVSILAWVLYLRHTSWMRRKTGHDPAFIAKQQRRAAIAGRLNYGKPKRGKMRSSQLELITNEAAKPWEAEGISRKTWYRRRSSQPELITNEAAKPWEAEGVSRAWWYRKRQKRKVDFL